MLTDKQKALIGLIGASILVYFLLSRPILFILAGVVLMALAFFLKKKAQAVADDTEADTETPAEGTDTPAEDLTQEGEIEGDGKISG